MRGVLQSEEAFPSTRKSVHLEQAKRNICFILQRLYTFYIGILNFTGATKDRWPVEVEKEYRCEKDFHSRANRIADRIIERVRQA